MKPGGILFQPNSTYIPKLAVLMTVSGRRKKGLRYHATLENFSADLVVEDELLDAEQAATFRSGAWFGFVSGDGSSRHSVRGEDPVLLHGTTKCQSTFSIEAFGFIPGWFSR